MSQIKICLVTPEYPGKTPLPGGIATYTADFARGLTDAGHEVHVLIAGTPENRTYREDGIHFHEIQLRYPKWFDVEWLADRFPLKELSVIWKTSRALNRIVQEYSIDIIETCSYQGLALFYLLRKKRPPVITRVTTTLKMTLKLRLKEFSRKQKFLFWLEREAIRLSEALAVPTRFHGDEVARSYNLPSSRFEAIALGVNLPEGSRGSHSCEGEFLNILSVGRLEARKGTDVLLKAIPKVLEAFPQTRFTFVGMDHKNRYEKQFVVETNNAFSDRVQFAGKVSDEELKRFYEACDMLVVPSRYESFGLIYLEANSYGKPAVGGAAGGVPEVIKDGFNGFLVPPDDVDALIEKMLLLLSDKDLRERMGAQGRLWVEEFFTKEHMIHRVLSQYKKVLGQENESAAVSEERVSVHA